MTARLTPEREATIRRLIAPGRLPIPEAGAYAIHELLAELDAVREELAAERGSALTVARIRGALNLGGPPQPGTWDDPTSPEWDPIAGPAVLGARLGVGSAAEEVMGAEVAKLRAERDWLVEEVVRQTGTTPEELANCMKSPVHRPVVNVRMGEALRAMYTAKDERDELRLTLAAERGDPAGALPGWEWSCQCWRRHLSQQYLGAEVHRADTHDDGWQWSLYGAAQRTRWKFTPTAREAMRAADAAIAALAISDTRTPPTSGEGGDR